MNDIQENQRSMADSTLSVMIDNGAIWSGLAGPSGIVTSLRDTLTLIDSNAVIQKGDTTGITKAKSQAREQMTNKAVAVAGGGLAFANATNNPALAGKFDYAKSDFTHARDTVVTDMATVVLEAAQGNAAGLADYNIDAAAISGLETAITAYHGLESSSRDAITARSTSTATLAELFKNLMDILANQLDPVMDTFMDAHSGFYKRYKEARKIIDLGRRGSGDAGEPVED